MTREEQIIEYLKERNIPLDSLEANSIMEGIEWADSHPNKKLVYTKKELLDMGFGFDLNGNIETPEKCYKRAEKYTKYRKKKLIDKACEWLENELFEDVAEPNPYYYSDVKSKTYDFLENFIEGFRKTMEE